MQSNWKQSIKRTVGVGCGLLGLWAARHGIILVTRYPREVSAILGEPRTDGNQIVENCKLKPSKYTGDFTLQNGRVHHTHLQQAILDRDREMIPKLWALCDYNYYGTRVALGDFAATHLTGIDRLSMLWTIYHLKW